VICERNPDYYEMGTDNKALPYLDSVVFRYVTDPTVALNDVRAGTTHVVEWIPTKDVAAVQADANLSLYRMPWAGQIYFYGGYNSKAKPFDDVRVRQAANYAIDREGMAKVLGFGVGVPHYWPQWGPGILGHDESHPRYPYDRAKVKQLLQQAGYADGTVSIELKVIAREPEQTIGEFVQNSWTQAGIKTKLVTLERLAWIDQVRANQFQACFWRGNLASSVVDPSALSNAFMCGSPGNWAQWCNPDVDKFMKEGGAPGQLGLDAARRLPVHGASPVAVDLPGRRHLRHRARHQPAGRRPALGPRPPSARGRRRVRGPVDVARWICDDAARSRRRRRPRGARHPRRSRCPCNP
jgi:peptide/nickel transport system substrate-binding protein